MDTSGRVTDAVQECASAVVSVLRDGHHGRAVQLIADPTDTVRVAAVRVLGADVLAPHALLGHETAAGDLEAARAAVAAFAPGPTAPVTTFWTYWGLCDAVRSIEPLGRREAPVARPDAAWVRDVPWPELAHRLALLAALATPGSGDALTRELSTRVSDVARGFAWAVRRRDWLQAAGVGRWLTLLDGVPRSLSLDTGLEFVRHLGADADARVDLHVQAARMIREAHR
ncbi:hypothetical protein [Actinophytocola oryzae]|uniref:Uncharacterized protein n=1 Tax=Actinophytocola oryzae TaxID=502181 RepID=A0A4R7VVA1_9PSEU|nr:hypothetical protein [Actinophytocola oryzae]TDV53933.1 hypothetical protein CLV71_104401 [Actinophytocola oryzae]